MLSAKLLCVLDGVTRVQVYLETHQRISLHLFPSNTRTFLNIYDLTLISSFSLHSFTSFFLFSISFNSHFSFSSTVFIVVIFVLLFLLYFLSVTHLSLVRRELCKIVLLFSYISSLLFAT